MDSKKKRNKKKKGNQGKNAADVMSKVGEAAPQHHNHESAPKDYYKDSDADDAMSSVEEGIPQYQNHEPTLQSDHNGTNAHVTTSSIGEGIPCYQDTEPTLTQGNHKASDAVPADQRSIGMSESSVELDMHRLYEAKLDKLHVTIKQLEDEKSLWLQKGSTMESELEKLHSKVCFHAQNEVLLEEKLNSLQIGYDELIKKEEVLGKKVRCIDDINGTLTRQEALLKERLSELEETNKTLVAQVKVLEEASSNTSAENHTLVKKLDELDSRLQALEARAALSEALEKVSDSKAIDPMNFTSPLYQQTIGFTEAMSKGNELIAERGLSSSVELITDNSYRQINNTPSNAYASNHAQETAIQLPEIGTSNSIAQAHVDVNEHHRFDGPTSEEIVPVPLDDIQIHEDDLRQPGAEDEIDEVPFSDAPITGAPFRLISFVARYVSGADLVNKK
ncbi:uncharacterized protein LOC120652464 isoform X4 [Panicum virgatum]|uniref:Uncharacterized protein n=1 Tax=Panicum virgatum TaxID=38727 RepID=A0A8T0NUE2_PANVG|nr:uncharacterized protein LOC120652464 isoform X4 [Panicum virgatum]XP_039786232.1 uncharacterized protein LOC120652464 isoform X4 [Panicum virgatum]KAG2552145.1 hypothetical protein PVAP13_9KG431900 [Panicum virgatum]KAG2552148.1 hypothetical protein PVAP13_9KG431900 [Panicum virgatum]